MLLATVLEARGARVSIVWPQREPPRWVYRAGLKPLALSRQIGADGVLTEADLIVTNGIFGWGHLARSRGSTSSTALWSR